MLNTMKESRKYTYIAYDKRKPHPKSYIYKKKRKKTRNYLKSRNKIQNICDFIPIAIWGSEELFKFQV